MWGNWYSHTLQVGMQNGTVPLESSMVISYKATHTSTIWPSNPFPKYLTKKNENMLTQKGVYECLDSIIHNSQNLETWMSINWWLNEQTVAYLQWEILLSNKELHNSMNFKNSTQTESGQTQKTTYNMFRLYDILEKATL